MRFLIPLFLLALLTACGPSGTGVFDDAGNDVGTVSVQSVDRAVIYDGGGSRAGTVEDEDVFDDAGSLVGEVSGNGRIFDDAGRGVGRISNNRTCIDRAGSIVGELGGMIDTEAAGGACLLLLLQ